jgi:glycosyltransferase involved in cell wall biosynthesis
MLATTPAACRHPSYKELRASIPDSLMPACMMPDPTLPLLPRFSRWQLYNRQWLSWICFRACYARLRGRNRPDFVLVPYFDDLELAVAAAGSPFGRTRWGGILMRNRFHHPAVNPFTPPVRLRNARRFALERNLACPTLGALLTIDETLTEYYRMRSLPQPKLRFIPEPADLLFTIPREDARRSLGLPADGCFILLYGHVDMRKGLAEAMATVASLPSEFGVRLLVFGPQGRTARRYISAHGADLRANGRLIEFDRFASLEEESLAFSATDLVWLGYSQHHGPSSVIGKSCRAGRPLIACREGNPGWTALHYKIGVIADVHNQHSLKDVVAELVRGGQPRWDEYREACRSYAVGRTGEDFGNAIVRMMEESAGQLAAVA